MNQNRMGQLVVLRVFLARSSWSQQVAGKSYTSHTWLQRASSRFRKWPDFEMTSAAPLTLSVRIERWPIAGTFTISRGAKIEAVTVVAEIGQDGLTGRGECVPYPRYGETPDGAVSGPRGDAGCRPAGTGPRSPAGRHARMRGPQRAGLRVHRPGGQAQRPAGLGPARMRPHRRLRSRPIRSRSAPRRRWQRQPPRPRIGRC